ncbi:MAG TPA: CPBP family intramembrane metalloprotease [Deltaproteobacteria bacterium]|nr:CPBP family intramembrane metalloprotease [Deltaproteobacteria bacterium]
MAVLFYLPVILGCLLYLVWSGGAYALETRTVGEDPLVGLGLGLLAAAPMVGISQAVVGRIGVFRRLGRALAGITGPMSWSPCLLLAASASVGEELLFRAVIQEHLGLAVGVLLFAAAHVPMERDLWLWPVLALGAGLIFGGLYEATGAALASTVAHFVVSLLNLRFLGQRFGVQSASMGSSTRPPRSPTRLRPPSP